MPSESLTPMPSATLTPVEIALERGLVAQYTKESNYKFFNLKEFQTWLATKPPQAPVTVGSRWTHTNGNVYSVYDLTNTQSDRPDKYPVLVSYCGSNGNTWSRKLSDWHRSMTPVPASTGTQTGRISAATPSTSNHPQG